MRGGGGRGTSNRGTSLPSQATAVPSLPPNQAGREAAATTVGRGRGTCSRDDALPSVKSDRRGGGGGKGTSPPTDPVGGEAVPATSNGRRGGGYDSSSALPDFSPFFML